MKAIKATWEDEENNRQILFSVQYEYENSAVEIKTVTPEKISFVCPESNSILRSIRVWTEKGRSFLANELDSMRIDQLKSQITERESAKVVGELICIL